MNGKHTAHDVDWVAIAEGVHVQDSPLVVRDQVGPGKHRLRSEGGQAIAPFRWLAALAKEENW